MAGRYDIEDVLDELDAFMKANLPAEIAAINAEKGNAPVLVAPANSAYFFQTWNDKILNANPAIFYGLQEVESRGVGPATVQVLKIFIDIIVLDNGQDNLTTKRVFRYTKAIQRLVEKNWDKKFSGMQKTKISVMNPFAFKTNLDSADEYKIGGVLLETGIG